jgi:hypothetical protein
MLLCVVTTQGLLLRTVQQPVGHTCPAARPVSLKLHQLLVGVVHAASELAVGACMLMQGRCGQHAVQVVGAATGGRPPPKRRCKPTVALCYSW